MVKLSKKAKIVKQKPAHVIDASVLFGGLSFEDDYCDKYLSAMGHKYRGFTTIPLIGEIFLRIGSEKDEVFRWKSYSYINRLLDKSVLNIIPIRVDRDNSIKEILDIDHHIHLDDATHISSVIASNFDTFITKEENIINDDKEISRERIKERLGLIICHPKKVIADLQI